MHITNETGPDRLVQLRFKPLWLYVDAVREFCGFFARATFEDEGLGQRVGLIVHELLENAVRYGDEKELEVRIEKTGGSIIISVENTTTDDKAVKLRAVFDELASQTPVAAYNRALAHAASLPATESGLGLPRVRYEGQVELELSTSPGRVSITARGNP
ncbi:MAG TPA: hypothetical protein VH062_31225 [Polyangiaceae bacterium]|nr:hypothetical protein [Polyangiaceae bacterium]